MVEYIDCDTKSTSCGAGRFDLVNSVGKFWNGSFQGGCPDIIRASWKSLEHCCPRSVTFLVAKPCVLVVGTEDTSHDGGLIRVCYKCSPKQEISIDVIYTDKITVKRSISLLLGGIYSIELEGGLHLLRSRLADNIPHAKQHPVH